MRSAADFGSSRTRLGHEHGSAADGSRKHFVRWPWPLVDPPLCLPAGLDQSHVPQQPAGATMHPGGQSAAAPPAHPHGKAGNQAAMIMAECPRGMARQIRNTMFTLVDPESWPSSWEYGRWSGDAAMITLPGGGGECPTRLLASAECGPGQVAGWPRAENSQVRAAAGGQGSHQWATR
jgi:hypothetical protein